MGSPRRNIPHRRKARAEGRGGKGAESERVRPGRISPTGARQKPRAGGEGAEPERVKPGRISTTGARQEPRRPGGKGRGTRKGSARKNSLHRRKGGAEKAGAEGARNPREFGPEEYHPPGQGKSRGGRREGAHGTRKGFNPETVPHRRKAGAEAAGGKGRQNPKGFGLKT